MVAMAKGNVPPLPTVIDSGSTKDNINVFLKACGNIGLKEAQLFHPGDLQDLSNRVTVKDLAHFQDIGILPTGPYVTPKAGGLVTSAVLKLLTKP
ncbi:hypothetical protein EK904_003171 [Melospiza melodia maxima]|nr:hypothetical protein EK904_003171 [Melospiza melodia maxima]